MIRELQYPDDDSVDTDETRYTCILSFVNDNTGQEIYAGSQDRPLKVDFNHEWIKESEMWKYSSSPILTTDAFPYDYPSGLFPNGNWFNEDPFTEFCNDNGYAPQGC